MIEIDAASNTSVDDVRALRDKINFSPNQGRYKVYIVDEVHMLSKPAFNALLKTLEEPPSHAIFILATTEVHKIIPTVLSRCQRHEFRRIPVVDIINHLEDVAQKEGVKVESSAIDLIARQATGSLRDAISLLDQLVSAGQDVTLEMAQNVLGTVTSQAVLELVDALMEKEAGLGLEKVNQALDAGSDSRQFAQQMVSYLRDVLFVRIGSAEQIDTTMEIRTKMAEHAQRFQVPELMSVIRAFSNAADEARGSWQLGLPLELAFLESLEYISVEEGENDSPETQLSTLPQEKGEPQITSQTQGSQKTGESSEFIQKWREILKLVNEEDKSTSALLRSVRERVLKGNTLQLGYSSDILKGRMEDNENLVLAEKVASEVFGMTIDIRCYVTSAEGEIPPGVDNSGMVATAVRLGGKIVDMNELGTPPKT
jgi:DNA polymerase-3 subunit gamma/tau